MPIVFFTGRGELKVESFRTKRVCKTGLRSENVMPKALEPASNVSTISTRPNQSRSISGTTAMALALIFAISALSAVFLLLQ
jgi:hypothetical protein